MRGLVPYQPGYAPPTPPPPKRRTGVIVALVAGGLAIVLCVVGVVVVGFSLFSASDPPRTWQEAADRVRAAAVLARARSMG